MSIFHTHTSGSESDRTGDVLTQPDNASHGIDRIILPTPRKNAGRAGRPDMHERLSGREFRTDALPIDALSSLLWIAFGTYRQYGNAQAAAMQDCDEIDIYIATGDGVYLYSAIRHELICVLARDVRIEARLRDFVGIAPLNFIYVANLARMEDASEQDKICYSGSDAGFIAQNVYLYCAAEGLATVMRGEVDRNALSRSLNLTAEQRIVLVQSIGYPVIPA